MRVLALMALLVLLTTPAWAQPHSTPCKRDLKQATQQQKEEVQRLTSGLEDIQARIANLEDTDRAHEERPYLLAAKQNLKDAARVLEEYESMGDEQYQAECERK